MLAESNCDYDNYSRRRFLTGSIEQFEKQSGLVEVNANALNQGIRDREERSENNRGRKAHSDKKERTYESLGTTKIPDTILRKNRRMIHKYASLQVMADDDNGGREWRDAVTLNIHHIATSDEWLIDGSQCGGSYTWPIWLVDLRPLYPSPQAMATYQAVKDLDDELVMNMDAVVAHLAAALWHSMTRQTGDRRLWFSAGHLAPPFIVDGDERDLVHGDVGAWTRLVESVPFLRLHSAATGNQEDNHYVSAWKKRYTRIFRKTEHPNLIAEHYPLLCRTALYLFQIWCEGLSEDELYDRLPIRDDPKYTFNCLRMYDCAGAAHDAVWPSDEAKRILRGNVERLYIRMFKANMMPKTTDPKILEAAKRNNGPSLLNDETVIKHWWQVVYVRSRTERGIIDAKWLERKYRRRQEVTWKEASA